MKTILIFIISSIILSCNSNKNVLQSELLNKTTLNCPQDGICSFEVLKNKHFIVKKDEFGNGYPEISEGTKTVLKFEYKKNTPPDVEDANYSEIIYIEIENDIETLNLTNIQLKKVNVGFSRLCFCRGQTGTYKITSGDLKISKKGAKDYTIDFNFKISEVPQVITSISETFTL